MDPSEMLNRRLRLRWALLLVGWIAWGVAMAYPIPTAPEGLTVIYRETLDMYLNGRVWRSPIALQAVLPLFVVASVVWGLSPFVMVLVHRYSVRAIRWLGWLLAGIVPTIVFITVVNGSFLAFYLFGISHLLACSAIVPWPGERYQPARGFEVLPPARSGGEP